MTIDTTTQEPQGTESRGDQEGLVTFSLEGLVEEFGLQAQEDPETGRSFYLWDDMFPLDDEGQPVPSYTVQEAAKVFFARGSDWLRWRYRPATHYPQGYFVLGDVILEPKRTPKGFRYYTLADIERMARALAENHAIDGAQLSVILRLVILQARLHRVIEDVQPE